MSLSSNGAFFVAFEAAAADLDLEGAAAAVVVFALALDVEEGFWLALPPPLFFGLPKKLRMSMVYNMVCMMLLLFTL